MQMYQMAIFFSLYENELEEKNNEEMQKKIVNFQWALLVCTRCLFFAISKIVPNKRFASK